jgi:predicted amidohydrolase YtcJ
MTEGDEDELPELAKSVAEADKAGLQVMVHAIGPAANSLVLDAFDTVIAANGPRDRRFRVEHAHRLKNTDKRRFASSDVIASMQPNLFFVDGSQASDDFRRLTDSGTTLAFGSDASIKEFDPMLGIYASVSSGLRSLTVDEAVRAYTIGSAFAEFQETQKGTISKGKLADLVILSDDIFKIEKRWIPSTKVLLTMVGGRVVYEANSRML